MRSETTMIAEQCRLQEWAVQIRECQDRPVGMSLLPAGVPACHGITKANYYYRLRRIREAFLDTLPMERTHRSAVLPASVKQNFTSLGNYFFNP